MSAQEKIIAYVEGQAIPNPTDCFAVRGEDSIIDMVHPVTGKTCIYGQTLEEVRARYPKAEIMPLDEFCQEKASRQDTPITWEPSTEEYFNEALESLPPACMRGNAFLIGEPYDHHAVSGAPRFTGYKHSNGIYYASSRPMTITEFKKEV